MEVGKNNSTSEAIWIKNNNANQVDDLDAGSPSRWRDFKRSWSVASSESNSSSVSSSSFSPFSALMGSPSKSNELDDSTGSGGAGYGGGAFSRRQRTYTTSSIGSDGERSPTFGSPPGPPLFRRSNSISAGCYNDGVFNNVVKRSMNVFNPVKLNTSLAVPIQKSVPKVRQPVAPDMKSFRKNSANNNMTERVVSFLCESAVR